MIFLIGKMLHYTNITYDDNKLTYNDTFFFIVKLPHFQLPNLG